MECCQRNGKKEIFGGHIQRIKPCRRIYHYSLFHIPNFKEVDPMAKRAGVAKAIAEISEAVPHLIRLPSGRAWIDYDEEADVLYVSLQRPQKATDTEFLEKKGILLRYREKELVGVTVLDASKRRKKNQRTRDGKRL